MKKNKVLLVTTEIQATWGNGEYEKVFFLENWCKKYTTKILYDNSTMDTYLRDRVKFERDHKYLEDIYERMLESLYISLNVYHNTSYSLRYWRIILGPWLFIYLTSVWDSWENLRIAFEKYNFDETILLNSDLQYEPPSSRDIGLDRVSNSHIWNHLFFAKILKTCYRDKIKFRYENDDSIVFENYKGPKKTFRRFIISWVDRLLGAIQRNHKFVLVGSYFNKLTLIKISIKLGQIPRLHTEFDKIIKMPKSSINRNKIIINLREKNKFELFLKNHIVMDIPVPYIEGYRNIQKKAAHLLPNCSVIFSASSYWNNELFKVFCAEKVDSGKKLIISEHGGALQSKYIDFSHREKISNVYTVWHKALNGSQIQLPPNLMINRKKSKKNGTNLVIVNVELTFYRMDHCSGPLGPLAIDDYQHTLKFIRKLDLDIKKHLKIRMKNIGNWNIKQRYADKLGVKFFSQRATLLEEYDHSKIIVCTYPMTTFMEAMFSGVPTILLYKKEYWEIHPEFDRLVGIMEDAKIIFSNPVAASDHINKIWSNPYLWWGSVKVIDARKEFFEQCGHVDDDWLDQWSDFFKEQLIN